jgi:hypothetical protein
MVVKCLWSGGNSLFHFSTCCKSLVSHMLLKVPKQTAFTWPQTNWTCDWFRPYGWEDQIFRSNVNDDYVDV